MKKQGADKHPKNLQKSTKMTLSIEPLVLGDRFLMKKLDFRRHCLRWFFDCFFQKGRKCEIGEEYNVKRGSEPSKPLIFALIFHKLFMLFSNTLLEAIFRGSKSPSILESSFLERCSIFQGSENPPTPAGVRRFKLNKPACRRRRLRRLALLTSRRPPGESKWDHFGIHFRRHFLASF